MVMPELLESEIDAIYAMADAGDEEAAALIDGLYADLESGIDVESAPEWFHEGQRLMMEAEEAEILVLCAAQSGKTASEPYWLLRETERCREFIRGNKRHGNALFAGPSQTLALSQAIPTFQELWEHELQLGRMVFSPKPKFVLSAEGCRRLLGSAETPVTVWFPYASDSNNIESVTAYAAVWDEAGQSENKQASYFAIKNRRLMIARSEGFGRLLMGTTPYEWGWLKTLVHDPVCGVDGRRLVPHATGSEVMTASADGVRVINWPAWLHPKNDRDLCFEERERMPEWEWQLTFMGLYSRPAGAIFDCWDDNNLVDEFDIPPWWKRFVGVDPGLNNTAAVFIAEEQYDYNRPSAPTGRYIVYRTYLDGRKTTREHVDTILKMAGGTTRPIAAGGSHTEEQVRESFQANGLGLMEPIDNDVEVQLSRMYAGIKTDRLVAFRRLSKFLAEINSYSRELGDDGQPTDKIKDKSKFHRIDATRYITDRIFREIPTTRKLTRKTT